ncbi:MAG: hypothetical protein KKB50_11220 [Planctomycetes bacterium]|nr:hypothetical protein [Planctomycetota bacterium]
MSTMPSVIVKKGGVLSALAYGFFTFLTTTVVCASCLAFYGLVIVDTKTSDVLAFANGLSDGAFSALTELHKSLPEWQKALPPALADSINDRRDPGYREQLDVRVRIVDDEESRTSALAVIEVTNNGTKTISLMTARIILDDERGVPVRELATFVATPLALCDDEWRGPLLPDETRRFTRRVQRSASEMTASIEITELRVWAGDEAAPTAAPVSAEGSLSISPLLVPHLL